MSGTFSPHLEVLPQVQCELWPLLAPVSALGFVLYGGTAIALRLGHRQSVDFDFFQDEPLDRSALNRALPSLAHAQVIQDQPDTLSALIYVEGSTHDWVKVSFFGGIDFGRVGEPEQTTDRDVAVASLDDLMATKLKVMLQRVEARDYRDVAAMLSAGIDLARGLAAARALFGPSFQPSESLKALAWFEGGDLATLEAHDRTALVDAVRAVRELPKLEIRSRRLQRDGRG